MKVIIQQDTDTESPRSWDNVGKMYCWHKRYNLGDVQPKADPKEFEATMPKGSVILPLYLYDHSGITMRTTPFGDMWDSGQVGFIVATPEDIRKNYACKRITAKIRAKVVEHLKQEVSIYDDYLTGNVYFYNIETDDGEHVDSCSGFYGRDIDGMVAHAGEEHREAIVAAWNSL